MKAANADELWWEENWQERSDEIARYFGHDSPPAMVKSFRFENVPQPVSLIPGACGMEFPGIGTGWRRDAFVTQGFALLERGARGPVEFAVLTDDPDAPAWAYNVLHLCMAEFDDQRDWLDTVVTPGRDADGPAGMVLEVPPDYVPGQHEAILLAPILRRPAAIRSTAGEFRIFAVTLITRDEIDFKLETSLAHLQLALCEAGVYQLSDPHRDSIFVQAEDAAALRSDIAALETDELSRQLAAVARHGDWC